MQTCVETAPPLFQTDRRRVTACYLYRDAPVLRSEQLARVFADGRLRQPAGAEAPLEAEGS